MLGTLFVPTVVFHAVFPKAGLYDVWAQFERQGQVITTPFVVQVGG